MVKKKPEAETGICSHDVSLNMVRDLFGRGLYVKYIINISNYITEIRFCLFLFCQYLHLLFKTGVKPYKLISCFNI
jgi:hypothetical protein